MFFFSSRRRHTRYWRDWSSDVCSSDLGVTLGAKSFPLDKDGNPIKGVARHPIIKDNVVIYANATILGRITIGEGCIVGANTWITKDMKPKTKKYRKEKIDNLEIEDRKSTRLNSSHA